MVLGLLALCGACGSKAPGASHATAVPLRSGEVLARLIHLPVAPLEVWYEQIPLGVEGGLGPTDYVLVAVLRLEPVAVERLVADASRG
jgi:hypothetical protein